MSVASIDDVGSCTTPNSVVAGQSIDCVVAALPADFVIAGCALKGFAAICADDDYICVAGRHIQQLGRNVNDVDVSDDQAVVANLDQNIVTNLASGKFGELMPGCGHVDGVYTQHKIC